MKKCVVAQDKHVCIRYLKQDDANLLAQYANNEKVSANLSDAFPNPYTESDAEKFLEKVEKQNPVTFFAIEYNGHYVGNISLLLKSDVHRKSAEIGYFIGEPFWNKGIATRAVNLITEWGFNHLDINRIYTGIFSYNLASQRVLEKCGFTKEGVGKQAIFKHNQFFDEIRYAKLK